MTSARANQPDDDAAQQRPHEVERRAGGAVMAAKQPLEERGEEGDGRCVVEQALALDQRMRRDGAPTSRKIAMTATGSVVATIAPSARQAMIETPANGASAKPIMTVATTTATMASSRIGAASSSICGTSIVSAD